MKRGWLLLFVVAAVLTGGCASVVEDEDRPWNAPAGTSRVDPDGVEDRR